ncbi:MAG: hypothetical protein ABIJ24_02400 [Nitrospinota bacterium]|nr:hypothetical protein [Nitrospinota bacterium]
MAKLTRVKRDQVVQCAKDYGLNIYQDIWHYSFNPSLIRNDFILDKSCPEKIVLYPHPAYIEDSCPALIYTNSSGTIEHQIYNGVRKEFEKEVDRRRKIFWYLHITGFKDFLDRRTAESSKPKKHFPTVETYEKTREKIGGETEITFLDEANFIKHYNRIKKEEHSGGKETILSIKQSVPEEWIKCAYLERDGDIVAAAILVDDGRSMSLQNVAAAKSNLGFGIFLVTEIIKYLSENNYTSFDAGVSGLYGVYKSKLFLDSKELYRDRVKWKRVKEILFHFMPSQ